MAKEKQKLVYLNPRFKVKLYDWGVFVGPAAGQHNTIIINVRNIG